MTENELKNRLRRIAGSCGAFARDDRDGLKDAAPDRPVIRLTFDDGPGPYTARLLDVLKANDVRATFFVTAQQPDHLGMITRAYEEGHSIGAHTFSHEYKTIYASDVAYYSDFLDCEEMIRSRIGKYSMFFRFPGGSSNTVSRICPGIMTRLSENMDAMGFRCFDWDVDSGDTPGAASGEAILRNIREGCAGRHDSIVLLHDIKRISVESVQEVISWGRANGYGFLPLHKDSPAARFDIVN